MDKHPLFSSLLHSIGRVCGVEFLYMAQHQTLLYTIPLFEHQRRGLIERRRKEMRAGGERIWEVVRGAGSWTEITVHYNNKESPCVAKASGSKCTWAENTESYRAGVHSLIFNQLAGKFCTFVAFYFLPLNKLLFNDPFFSTFLLTFRIKRLFLQL